MKKFFKAPTIISFFLVFLLSLATPLYPYDFDRYKQDDSFGLPSVAFQSFQQELARQKGVFSPAFNAYENFTNNNISRNLFGFDVTDPVSVAANFAVQKELASLPETVISADVSNLISKEFYLPQATKKPVEIEAQSVKGAELFSQQFSGLEINANNQAANISSEDIVPSWFKPGKSIFEPTQSEQVSGQDVEAIKNRLSKQDSLISNVSVRSDLPLERNEGKFTDAIPQAQSPADLLPQIKEQGFEKELAQVIPVTPLKLINSDSAIMPGESWEKVKNQTLDYRTQAIDIEDDKQIITPEKDISPARNQSFAEPEEVKIENSVGLPEAEKQKIDNAISEHLNAVLSDDFKNDYDGGSRSSIALRQIVDLVRQSDNVEVAKQYVAEEFNLEGKRKDIWMDYDVLVVFGNRQTISDKEAGLIHYTLSNIPAYMRGYIKAFMSVDHEAGIGGWTFSEGGIGVICMNDILQDYKKSPFPGFDSGEQTYVNVIFHEAAHVLEFSGFVTAGQLNKRDALWNASRRFSHSPDFARDYGMYDQHEDFATMAESYALNTKEILKQGMMHLSRGGGDILLCKVELIADIYSHFDDNGNKVAYVFKIDAKGFIERKEIPLMKERIYGREYWLPSLDELGLRKDYIKQ